MVGATKSTMDGPTPEAVVVARPAAPCKACHGKERSFRRKAPGPPSWWGKQYAHVQTALAEGLESKPAHLAVIVLVVLDLLIVITELILSGFYPTEDSWTHAGARLPCAGCTPPSTPTGSPAPLLLPAAHTAETALSWTSISILCVFVAEQFVRLAVFGPRYFCSWWHALDAAIVVTSLVLELVLKGIERETLSLLVVFRLWRLVRIMHAVSEGLELRHEEALEAHHAEMEALAAQLAAARAEVRQLQGRVAALEGASAAAAAAG